MLLEMRVDSRERRFESLFRNDSDLHYVRRNCRPARQASVARRSGRRCAGFGNTLIKPSIVFRSPPKPRRVFSSRCGVSTGPEAPKIVNVASGTSTAHAPSAQRIALGYLVIYVVWGSTYLAMRIAVETLPPFLMAGARFLLAGGLLLGWLRLRGAALPTRIQWRNAWGTGSLLFLGGNGLVVWAEKVIPSGLAALIVATIPLWMALFEWVRPGGAAPGVRTSAGILLGFAGIALLFAKPSGASAVSGLHLPQLLAVVLASALWALGSMLARTSPKPASIWMWTASQMICGGVMLLLVAGLLGESVTAARAEVSMRSLGAFFYLLVFGSWLGFGTFVWLMQVSSPTKVSTYAYVNPVVAIFLGWALAGEEVNARTLLSSGVTLAGVLLITLPSFRRARPVPSRLKAQNS